MPCAGEELTLALFEGRARQGICQGHIMARRWRCAPATTPDSHARDACDGVGALVGDSRRSKPEGRRRVERVVLAHGAVEVVQAGGAEARKPEDLADAAALPRDGDGCARRRLSTLARVRARQYVRGLRVPSDRALRDPIRSDGTERTGRCRSIGGMLNAACSRLRTGSGESRRSTKWSPAQYSARPPHPAAAPTVPFEHASRQPSLRRQPV